MEVSLEAERMLSLTDFYTQNVKSAVIYVSMIFYLNYVFLVNSKDFFKNISKNNTNEVHLYLHEPFKKNFQN